ncbi:hypothetical protein EST38_g2813 [Candolleomyces aberdarensis]|uniref:F-box domain-containing protein n=1 Tax=Candolleomyces aberdarensis TaxID=2316362 RepID=A0A4V1Q4S0_9AGAR|nr:hypothetical protein EST38_g2813 [Candolleomyces aberdarensis]
MKLKEKVLSLWKRSKSPKDDSQPECEATVTPPSCSPITPEEDSSPSLSVPRAPPVELGDLPDEILILILTLACENQVYYRNLLLTSKGLRTIAQSECFGHFPIRLRTEAQTLSFHNHLTNHPKLGPLVRYLWMNGPRFEASDVYPNTIPEDSLPLVQYRIIERLTGLKALVCPYHVFQHIGKWSETHPDCCSPKLQEIEILDTCNQSWSTETYRFYRQITHLSLLEPCPEWAQPTQWKLFPNLVGFAFELHARHPSALIFTKNIREDDALREIPPGIEIAITMAQTDSRRQPGFEIHGELAYAIYCGKLRYYDRWLRRLERDRQLWFLYHS